MSTTTTEQITELQDKITTAEQQARAATEEDRERLAELRRRAEAEEHAEGQRRAARRRAWAAHYLEHEHAAAEQAAGPAVTAARREFERVLAEQPWVRAMLDWQGALAEQQAVRERGHHARAVLGLPSTVVSGPANVLPMLDGRVDFTPLGRVLHYLAEARTQESTDPEVEVDELVAHADGKGDPLAAAVTATGVTKDHPLAYLARTGDRLDVTRHETKDGPKVKHTNVLTDEWVITDPAGTVLAVSWSTKGNPAVEHEDEDAAGTD